MISIHHFHVAKLSVKELHLPNQPSNIAAGLNKKIFVVFMYFHGNILYFKAIDDIEAEENRITVTRIYDSKYSVNF